MSDATRSETAAGQQPPAGYATGAGQPRRRAPGTVVAVSVLLLLLGALGVLFAIDLLSQLGKEAGHGMSVNPLAYLVGLLQLAVSATQMVGAAYLWRGRGWARTVVTVVCVINCLGGLVMLLQGMPASVAAIGFNVALIAAVNGEKARGWCG